MNIPNLKTAQIQELAPFLEDELGVPIKDLQKDGMRVLIIIELAKTYYRQPGNHAGGNLHVCLDDGVVDDVAAANALDYAGKKEDADGQRLAQALVQLPETLRLEVVSRYDEYSLTADELEQAFEPPAADPADDPDPEEDDDVEEIAADDEEDEYAEVAYNHRTKVRCPAHAKNHPTFVKCGSLMKSRGTRDGGRLKRWVCTRCGHKLETAGRAI